MSLRNDTLKRLAILKASKQNFRTKEADDEIYSINFIFSEINANTKTITAIKLHASRSALQVLYKDRLYKLYKSLLKTTTDVQMNSYNFQSTGWVQIFRNLPH